MVQAHLVWTWHALYTLLGAVSADIGWEASPSVRAWRCACSLGHATCDRAVDVEGSNASAVASQTPDAQAASGHAFWLLAGMLRLDKRMQFTASPVLLCVFRFLSEMNSKLFRVRAKHANEESLPSLCQALSLTIVGQVYLAAMEYSRQHRLLSAACSSGRQNIKKLHFHDIFMREVYCYNA